ncbi:hypothetical protein BDB00DRAFT_808072 [Zychaea mexicana]|uniref:uncharacterized protein n=1 Tax=Zychaea mexicana TaxID=64656 RepID=UPI0022FEB9E2|nr:uncharacterized protein BDB00DRAFT_808072 [Zychaea mexicana]KAI9496623.1 hypothetical protein BDB00DRAFT_808072 [Zychaea mexicana]
MAPSRHSRSPSPPRRRRRSPSYSRSRSPSDASSRSRSPIRSVSPPPRNTVLITNLTRNVNAEHIKEIFSQFGTVRDIDFPFNTRLNTNGGRAFVEYETKEDVDKAISYMDGGQLDGKYLEVAVAPPPRRRSPSPPPRRRSK